MARRYDLTTARFSQPDPYGGSYSLTDPQSLNRYAYTKNDPVNFTDPSGLNVEAPDEGDVTCIRYHYTNVATGAGFWGGQMCYGGSGGGGGGGGGSAPIQNLPANVQKLLDSKDCAKTVQKLLDTAAEMFPKWQGQNSESFREAYNRIASQGGYVPSIPAEASHYGGTVDGDAFASLEGHGARPAVAYLHPFNYFGSLTRTINRQAQLYYAYNALHETFHLAARGGYSDEDMAKVVSKITGWSLPQQGSAVPTFSRFWDRYLGDHCRPQ